MSSINLLPKNTKFGAKLIEREKSNVTFIVSFLMILSSIVFFVNLYISNYYALEEIKFLNFQVEAADKEIKKEVSDNEFLIAEVKAKEDNLLLEKHTYFTKALNLVRNNLMINIYLDDLSIDTEENGFVVFKINGVAKNYQTITSQVGIFKNLSSVESVNVPNISVDDNGYERFDAVLKFKEEILFYEN